MDEKVDRDQQFRDVFSMWDREGKGIIPKTQLRIALKALGQHPTEEDLNSAFSVGKVSADATTITLEQFSIISNYLLSQLETEDSILQAFKSFDILNKGRINAKELRNALINFGPGKSASFLKSILNILNRWV
jgi:calmodulin